MDFLQNMALGLSVLLTPTNLLFCFIGVLLGTLVGVLPGLGPTAAISLLLPSTFSLDPASAVIMLAGIFYGAMYGGSTTSILVNIPGEAASVVTCLDGYQMARQGRAGPALGMSAFASFISGTLSIVALMVIAPPLVKFALKFGPPEYFGLVFCGLSILIYLAMGSMLKAVIMAVIGLFFGTIGSDFVTGYFRFTLDRPILMDGIGLVPLVMGVFGVAEVLDNLERDIAPHIFRTTISNLLPNRKDWKLSIGPISRGTLIGFFVGILPGGSASISTFAAYALEKKISKDPKKFGRGAIEGVASPEAANNAAAGASFIPLMTLGIPANVIMALLLGALLIHGVQPGPLFIKQHPDIFWGVIMSMYVGNIMLLFLNLPLIPLWVKILKIPYSILFPLILLFCLIGAYSLNNNFEEVIVMIIFGIFGYLMRKFEYEPAPLIFAFVLSTIFENSFRQSLLMSHGSFAIFFTRPIALIFMIVGITFFLMPMFLMIKKKATKS